MKGATRDKVLRRDALPVPQNLPMGTRCVTVTIPDDDEYFLQFYSILTLLTKWNSYQQDGETKAADVAYLWKQALKLTDCDEPKETFDGVFVEDCMGCGFRINPDNNCQMQIWCNGEWELFWDISSCVVENVKQATNGTALSEGECRVWNVALAAYNVWLLPVSVNAGDVIVTDNFDGGWWDGSGLWRCPDGQDFVFGVCSGLTYTDGADPAPTVNHMSVLMDVDGDLVSAINNTYVVPPGVVNAQVKFFANKPIPTSGAGTISFDVEVCAEGKLKETLTIPMTTYLGPSTSFNTNPDKMYKLTFSGQGYPDNPDLKGDAFYCSTDDWATHDRHVNANVCTGYLDVSHDCQPFATIPPYNADHTYVVYIPGTGAPFVIIYADDFYGDNSGSLLCVVEEA